MFFYEVEGHMQKLSSFGQGKKIRPKKSLMWLLHEALQFRFRDLFSFQLFDMVNCKTVSKNYTYTVFMNVSHAILKQQCITNV